MAWALAVRAWATPGSTFWLIGWCTGAVQGWAALQRQYDCLAPICLSLPPWLCGGHNQVDRDLARTMMHAKVCTRNGKTRQCDDDDGDVGHLVARCMHARSSWAEDIFMQGGDERVCAQSGVCLVYWWLQYTRNGRMRSCPLFLAHLFVSNICLCEYWIWLFTAARYSSHPTQSSVLGATISVKRFLLFQDCWCRTQGSPNPLTFSESSLIVENTNNPMKLTRVIGWYNAFHNQKRVHDVQLVVSSFAVDRCVHSGRGQQYHAIRGSTRHLSSILVGQSDLWHFHMDRSSHHLCTGLFGCEGVWAFCIL